MTESIHLIAACGTGMGTLACSLKEMGYSVTGSDLHVYPPMSDFLKAHGIHLFEGFKPEHLSHRPDLVIIGNAVSRDNPEAAAVIDNGMQYLSMPQAVNRFLAHDKHVVMVTGTHGKTTTSSIMAHILVEAGLDPSFMIGGILKNYDSSFRIGQGKYMVIEGDEYDTAFFDKGPKFMHYHPDITIVTGIEFDHADIFDDVEQIKKVFSDMIIKNKENSLFITFNESEHLGQVLLQSGVNPLFYGPGANWSFTDYTPRQMISEFTVKGPENESLIVHTALPGEHNANNIVACIAAAKDIGVSDQVITQALTSFQGIKRRQEIRGIRQGITVMDDFAHHPTAVAETIRAVKPFYPHGRVIAVFEPRTNTSMRHFFQQVYPGAFREADLTLICEPSVQKKIDPDQKFSCEMLAADIRSKGKEASSFETADALISFLLPQLKSGDLVLIMSNGGFDNIHNKILESIG